MRPGDQPGPRVLLALALVLATVGLARGAVLLAQAAGDAVGEVRAQPLHQATTFEPLVTLAAALGALACLVWLGLGLVLTVLSALPPLTGTALERVAVRVTPSALHRVATTLLGVAVAGASPGALPAAAAAELSTGSAGQSLRAPDPEPGAALLPDLDRPVAARGHEQRRGCHPGPAGRARVVVRSGDSLWRIAARALPARTARTRADRSRAVAAAWPAWYAANRARIGPDPDLLLPGQVLTRPPHLPLEEPQP